MLRAYHTSCLVCNIVDKGGKGTKVVKVVDNFQALVTSRHSYTLSDTYVCLVCTAVTVHGWGKSSTFSISGTACYSVPVLKPQNYSEAFAAAGLTHSS